MRNQNYRDILARLPFTNNGDVHNEFDHFFWFGDLNYRIHNLSRDEIIKFIKEERYDVLRENDQLLEQVNVICVEISNNSNKLAS